MVKWRLVVAVATCLFSAVAALLVAPYDWGGTFEGISPAHRAIGVGAALASFVLGCGYYVWHFANWRRRQRYSLKGE